MSANKTNRVALIPPPPVCSIMHSPPVYLMTETGPISKTCCLEKVKIMDKEQNSHIRDVMNLTGSDQHIYLKQETN
jgi:hypothetical protein